MKSVDFEKHVMGLGKGFFSQISFKTNKIQFTTLGKYLSRVAYTQILKAVVLGQYFILNVNLKKKIVSCYHMG